MNTMMQQGENGRNNLLSNKKAQALLSAYWDGQRPVLFS